jgi:hypothetical protein
MKTKDNPLIIYYLDFEGKLVKFPFGYDRQIECLKAQGIKIAMFRQGTHDDDWVINYLKQVN